MSTQQVFAFTSNGRRFRHDPFDEMRKDDDMDFTSVRPSANSQWVFKTSQATIKLPVAPIISATGQVALQVDARFIQVFEGWLAGWVSGRSLPLSFEILAHGYDMKEKVRYEIKQASITSLGFPALDRTLQTPARLSLALQATGVSTSAGSNKLAASVSKQMKLWRCCDFQLLVQGLETHKVGHIDSITAVVPGIFPDLKIWVPMSEIQGFVQQHQNGKAASASVRYCQNNLTPLFSLAFTTKVISVVSPAGKVRDLSNPVAKVPVHLSVTGQSFSIEHG